MCGMRSHSTNDAGNQHSVQGAIEVRGTKG
jgi:hypothetical protein